MGLTQVCIFCHKYRRTFICLILFAFVFTVQAGRSISNFGEVAQENMRTMVAKPQIGSRPPKCEKICSTCGHCEAVQVPVVPQLQNRRHYSSAKATTVVTYSSRVDNLSNYKPLSWKCKCGDYLCNP